MKVALRKIAQGHKTARVYFCMRGKNYTNTIMQQGSVLQNRKKVLKKSNKIKDRLMIKENEKKVTDRG